MKNGDQEIPFDKFTFELNIDPILKRPDDKVYTCLDFYKKAQDAVNDPDNHNPQNKEKKDQYAAKLHSIADEIQLELMLTGRSWKQYMDGAPTPKDFEKEYEKIAAEGGSFYDAIDQMDWPDSEKERYINSYEDAYIEGILKETYPKYPNNGSIEEKMEWSQNFLLAKDKYKKEHPNYKKEAMAHANSYRFGKYKNH